MVNGAYWRMVNVACCLLQGPISITVAAGGIGWQLYSSGVYSGGITKNCGFTRDHGVQVPYPRYRSQAWCM